MKPDIRWEKLWWAVKDMGFGVVLFALGSTSLYVWKRPMAWISIIIGAALFVLGMYGTRRYYKEK